MYELSIPAMTCGHCRQTIGNAVVAVDSEAVLDFDLDAHKVIVSTTLPYERLRIAIEAAGYPIAAVTELANESATELATQNPAHHCDQCDG